MMNLIMAKPPQNNPSAANKLWIECVQKAVKIIFQTDF